MDSQELVSDFYLTSPRQVLIILKRLVLLQDHERIWCRGCRRCIVSLDWPG